MERWPSLLHICHILLTEFLNVFHFQLYTNVPVRVNSTKLGYVSHFHKEFLKVNFYPWLLCPFLFFFPLSANHTTSIQFSSVQSLSHVQLFATPWTTARQPPCPSPTTGVHPNPCPLSWWCHPTISSTAIPFSSCPQSCPASGSFPMSQLFTSGGQSIGFSYSTSVLPMNTQDWSPLGWSGWISLQSKGLSRVFSNTTVQKHQFFGAQLSSQSNSHIHTWPLEKP